MSTRTEWQPPPELWQRLKPLARQMRKEPTPAEYKLWQRLRNRQILNVKFRRQFAIDRFIVDFCSPEVRMIIEVDGPIHQYTQEEDKIRQDFLESLGFVVLRFTNLAVLNQTQAVVTEIEQQACKLMDMLSLSISLLERPAELMPELEQLGARHVGYGVRAEHYDTVSTALFGMLAAVLRDKYTAPVEAAWRELYRVIRDTMLRGATGGSAGDRPGARPGA
ncbi:MAG: DUF559 domain-containing protein [Opitutaceae bacterium]|nr:DUF559 domain-containing protein [Opitutaceae bacterium]